MSDKPRYVHGYAVVRIDGGQLNHPSHVREYVVDGVVQPAAGPSNVTVKEVVTTAEEARREVVRLNAINAEKGCEYFWQSTHVFFDGGSHGSVGSGDAEGDESA